MNCENVEVLEQSRNKVVATNEAKLECEPKEQTSQLSYKHNHAGLVKLDNLIGLIESKAQIRKIIAFHAMRQLAILQGRKVKNVSYHMQFIGNPGTAKTTTARIFAEIMYEEGIIASENLVEATRADVVAEYCGHTAIKVRELFNRAYGGVLFIDEAYSLLDDRPGGYGDEAINSLVVEMENHKNDTVVILAGYPKQMEELFERNPGLRSRVPFTVRFPNYSAGELFDIAQKIAFENGYTFGSDVRSELIPVFEVAVKDSCFSNGRFARNLVENAQMTKAEKLFSHIPSISMIDDCFVLNACDFDLQYSKTGKTSHNPIGFS